MRSSVGEAQNLLLLGGTSDIGVALLRELVGSHTLGITLACRRLDEGERVAASLRSSEISVDVVAFDATRTEDHGRAVTQAVQRYGDLDVAIIAYGQLGSGVITDVNDAVGLAAVNFGGAIASCIAVANRMRHQGHGHIVVLSSVAGSRVRKANAVYGATKAGLDGFALALADELQGSGVSVTVVRPGFVHSKMTAGMKPAPFSTTPSSVARATVEAMRSGARVVWVPRVLAVVLRVLRALPSSIWRKIQ